MIIQNYADQAQAITMPNNKPVKCNTSTTYPGHLRQYLVLTILLVVRYTVYCSCCL